jgi:hypothetical protein
MNTVFLEVVSCTLLDRHKGFVRISYCLSHTFKLILFLDPKLETNC